MEPPCGTHGNGTEVHGLSARQRGHSRDSITRWHFSHPVVLSYCLADTPVRPHSPTHGNGTVHSGRSGARSGRRFDTATPWRMMRPRTSHGFLVGTEQVI